MEKLCNNPKVPKPNKSKPRSIMIERGNPLSGTTQGPRKVEEKRPVPQEIETRSFHEEAVEHDRTVTPVVGRDASHEPGDEQSVLNEVNIDSQILGLPHSVVKQPGELSCS